MTIAKLKTEEKLDSYDKIMTMLEKHHWRAVPSKPLKNFLKVLFNEEQAQVVSGFRRPNDPTPASTIAKRTGVPIEKVISVLDDLGRESLIISPSAPGAEKDPVYMSPPFVIGLFEYFNSSYKSAKRSPEDLKKAAQYFEQIIENPTFAMETQSEYPAIRIIPHGHAVDETVMKEGRRVEINETLKPVENVVYPFEKVSEVVKSYENIAVMPCSCKVHHQALGHPIRTDEDCCMVFGMGARWVSATRMGRSISQDEALKLLKRFEKKGLVHQTGNSQEISFICNCEPSVCGLLRVEIDHRLLNNFANRQWRSRIDESQECNDCNLCLERCPSKAIRHQVAHPDIKRNPGREKWWIDEDWCMGCGICVSVCPKDRYYLEKIDTAEPAVKSAKAYKRFEKNRIYQ